MVYLVALWYAALAPLVFLIAFRRSAPVAFWIAALAFSVSWFADTVDYVDNHSWAATTYYPWVQYPLFILAALRGREVWPAVGLYAGLGTLLYLGMIGHRSDPAPYTSFFRWWWPYQGTRLASFGLFGYAAWRTG